MIPHGRAAVGFHILQIGHLTCSRLSHGFGVAQVQLPVQLDGADFGSNNLEWCPSHAWDSCQVLTQPLPMPHACFQAFKGF